MLKRLKPLLRWVILGAVGFFLAQTLHRHWQEVAGLRPTSTGWVWVILALAVTLLAHVWAGWVWGWILQTLQQPGNPRWTIPTYLKTNLAKYLPGNVWHYYGRIQAATTRGTPLGIATLSVLLEPLLMATAALIVALVGIGPGWADRSPWIWSWLCLGLGAILLLLAPPILNPLVGLAQRFKGRSPNSDAPPVTLSAYPLRPLLGELLFLGLRGTGFILTALVLTPLSPGQLPQLLGVFSLAWLVGLVIPGAPGGMGVFEATAIALLDRAFAPGLLLGIVALYRLVSLLAEVIGAALVWLTAASHPKA